VGAGMATYHLVYQLASRYGVISVNEKLNPIFIRAIKEAGCYERLTSMHAIGKPLTLPMGKFYTPEELEVELLRIGQKQVEEGAQVLVIACTLISLFLKPGAFDRLKEKLGVMVIDPQPIALKTAEMLACLDLSQSDQEYPSLEKITCCLS
jgi:Asp/Glu/hydantoin racemase